MRVLIVEDDYLAAQDLAAEVRSHGDSVVGPFASDMAAFEHVDFADVAILDLRLGDDCDFLFADMLVRNAIPFLFVSGFETGTLPPRLRHIRLFTRPCDTEAMLAALRQGMAPRQGAGQFRLPVDRAQGDWPVEEVLSDLMQRARDAIPDPAAAERLVGTVLQDALRRTATRPEGPRLEDWLLGILEDEIRCRLRSYLH